MINIIDVDRTFHLQPVEYILFSSPWGTSSKRDHTLHRKTSLSKFRKTEITSIPITRVETRNQLQKENCIKKKKNYIETEQHATRQLMVKGEIKNKSK